MYHGKFGRSPSRGVGWNPQIWGALRPGPLRWGVADPLEIHPTPRNTLTLPSTA